MLVRADTIIYIHTNVYEGALVEKLLSYFRSLHGSRYRIIDRQEIVELWWRRKYLEVYYTCCYLVPVVGELQNHRNFNCISNVSRCQVRVSKVPKFKYSRSSWDLWLSDALKMLGLRNSFFFFVIWWENNYKCSRAFDHIKISFQSEIHAFLSNR